MARLSRYSRWDGTQAVPDLDADQLLSAMSDDLLADGDLWNAFRRLFQRGAQDPQGGRMPGLQDLLKRLKQERQQRLEQYDMGSVLEDIKKQLADILKTERAGIERDVPPGAQQEQKLQRLDAMPPDPAGQIKALQDYPFTDAEAKRKFDELMKSLQEQMLKPFMQGMQQGLQNLTPEDLKRMREMMRDLNNMLRERAQGGEPDFQAFKAKWGQNFPMVDSLDQLLVQMGKQMGQMQSLMQSLTPGQRQQLQDMMQSLFAKDERLEAEMAQLAMNLEDLLPMDALRRPYDFKGDENLSMKEAMRVMEELQQMDQLERQLRRAKDPGDLDKIDESEVERLLGEEAARDLQKLRELAKKLEEAGYLENKGGKLQLTARAIRKIGDKALRDVFDHLKRDRFGRHAVSRRGAGGDRTDDAKRYEFGDPFLLDLRGTLMHAVERGGAGTPVRLSPDDFEVWRTELSTQAATVVLLDLSRSMLYNGCFLPAKKVALALHALIRGQFPRDSLHIVGFSLYAREFSAAELPELSPSGTNIGTNMHAAFMLARTLLGRQKGGNKQIIMITDGEPTAHMEGGEAEFSYPPTRRTLQETLKEVQRCTREGITINTFMLERSAMLAAFVEQMTKINRGRAFFATPERLGEYVLVDYVSNKRRAAS
ncbi:MAG: VWA domain-containing protein [Candidatus Rokubacteria bacterium]|nr:VWA domain-containing protein [Candidatus Rokubacteria bacterium]